MEKPVIFASNRNLTSDPAMVNEVIFMDIGDSLMVNTGKKITVRCPISGIPNPESVWKLNGKDIDKVDGFEVDAKNEILIKSVDENHAGILECLASNTAGVAYASSHIQVVGEKVYIDFLVLICSKYHLICRS